MDNKSNLEILIELNKESLKIQKEILDELRLASRKIDRLQKESKPFTF